MNSEHYFALFCCLIGLGMLFIPRQFSRLFKWLLEMDYAWKAFLDKTLFKTLFNPFLSKEEISKPIRKWLIMIFGLVFLFLAFMTIYWPYKH
jgi:hypothetical protein